MCKRSFTTDMLWEVYVLDRRITWETFIRGNVFATWDPNTLESESTLDIFFLSLKSPTIRVC